MTLTQMDLAPGYRRYANWLTQPWADNESQFVLEYRSVSGSDILLTTPRELRDFLGYEIIPGSIYLELKRD